MGERKGRRAGQDAEELERMARRVAKAVSEVRHGTIEVIVQDSRVIQMNITEKIRLDKGDMYYI